MGMTFTLATAIGFDPNPAIDNTPAWNAMVAPGGPSHVLFDGVFSLKSPPNPITRHMRLDGININASGFTRDYSPASLTEPMIRATKTTVVEKLGIIAKQGGQGIGVMFDGLGASDSIIRDCYITGNGGVWCVPLSFHAADTLGIRGCYAGDCELFAATHHLLWATNVRGLSLMDVNCYPAGGTVDYATVQHGAGGRSDGVHWLTRYLTKLYLYNTDNVTLRGMGPITVINSGSTNVRQV